MSNQKNLISVLSRDLLLTVFKLLNPKTLRDLRQINKLVCQLIDTNFSKELACNFPTSTTLQNAIEKGEKALLSYLINNKVYLTPGMCTQIIVNINNSLRQIEKEEVTNAKHYEEKRRENRNYAFTFPKLYSSVMDQTNAQEESLASVNLHKSNNLIRSQKLIYEIQTTPTDLLLTDKSAIRLLKKFGFMKANSEFVLKLTKELKSEKENKWIACNIS